MKIKLLVFSLIILFSFLVLLQKTEARKGALFCVCTKNCGESGPVRGSNGCETAKEEYCTTCPQDCGACTPPPPPPPPPPSEGVYSIEEQCNAQGTEWDIINTACVQTCTPTP